MAADDRRLAEVGRRIRLALDGGPLDAALGLLGDEGRSLRTELAQAAALLEVPESRVVFGGHFNSGKSTLLNALLGRDVLPTAGLPETGIPCWIRSGPSDAARALHPDGVQPLELTRAAIAEQVSLVTPDKEYREGGAGAERLEFELEGSAPAPGTVWVDSPGINDTEAMDARAIEVASAGDLLVWTVPSHHALGMAEQEFLADHLDRLGPASVLVVVNVFLAEPTEECWEEFIIGDARAIQRRVVGAIELASPDGSAVVPPVVFVSAAAAGDHPEGFGLPRLVAELGSMGVGSARLRSSRLLRADAVVRRTDGALQELVAAQQRAEVERTQDAEARRRAAEAALPAYRQHVDELGEALVAQAMTDMGVELERLRKQLWEAKPAPAGTLQRAWRDRVRGVIGAFVDEAASGAEDRAERSGLAIRADLADQLTASLDEAAQLTVPAWPTAEIEGRVGSALDKTNDRYREARLPSGTKARQTKWGEKVGNALKKVTDGVEIATHAQWQVRASNVVVERAKAVQAIVAEARGDIVDALRAAASVPVGTPGPAPAATPVAELREIEAELRAEVAAPLAALLAETRRSLGE